MFGAIIYVYIYIYIYNLSLKFLLSILNALSLIYLYHYANLVGFNSLFA